MRKNTQQIQICFVKLSHVEVPDFMWQHFFRWQIDFEWVMSLPQTLEKLKFLAIRASKFRREPSIHLPFPQDLPFVSKDLPFSPICTAVCTRSG